MVSFINCSTLESVFKKFRFRGFFYADTSAVVWTEGPNRNNKVAFSNVSGIAWTGRGLRSITTLAHTKLTSKTVKQTLL